jgi:hypothetical protein
MIAPAAELVEALRLGNSLALVGAGISIWAGYGSWGQVIEHLADAVRALRPELNTQQIIHNNRNPLHCANHLGAYLGPRFAEFIQAEFGPNGTKPNDLLFRLCSLPFKHFLTLNFDYSLEQIHGTLGRPYNSVTTRNLPDLIKFMRSHDGIDVARCVLHLHGTCRSAGVYRPHERWLRTALSGRHVIPKVPLVVDHIKVTGLPRFWFYRFRLPQCNSPSGLGR